MKIVALVRTRNELRNIDRFCKAYAWADAVLVADGGSDDDTIWRAKVYPNVKAKYFLERIERNGHWRNPHGKHINFLIDWGIAEGADWLIFDDCDCVPTQALRQEARRIFETATKPVVELYRLYIWGSDQYFPDMNLPGQSLYAWRADWPIRASEVDPMRHIITGWQPDTDALKLEPPYACLHYTWPDEVELQRKMDFYAGIREVEMIHPLLCRGALEELPGWAR